MKTISVSVIIPVYNSEKYLKYSVLSALKHDEVKEVIIIDDGSTDNSFKICIDLKNESNKISVYQHPFGKNKGCSASRNLGIKMAKYDYIVFLDSDDYFTDSRFDFDNKIFTTDSSIDVTYGAMGFKYEDEIGSRAWENKMPLAQSLTAINGVIDPKELFNYIIGLQKKKNISGYFTLASMTIKRMPLLTYKIDFPVNINMHEDTVFIFKVSYYLRCLNGKYYQPIAIRRVHCENRIIFNKGSNYKILMYKTCIKWAITSNLNSIYITYFFKKYLIYIFKMNFIFKSIFILITDYFRNSYLRKAYFVFILKKARGILSYK